MANRYPAPALLGWKGEGDLDAAKTHLAKVRAMERYLATLSAAEDDDLVLVVDGYDVIHQLPADVLIERYFDIALQADKRVAKRFNTSVEEARSRGLRQTVFLGPDKVCWPIDHTQPRCWAVPSSTLPPNAFGPDKGGDNLYYTDPKWLNSGTIIGPIGDFRKFITATMEEIKTTYDAAYEFKESDQYYMANIWGRQEYWRSKAALKGGEVQGGPDNRVVPEKGAGDKTSEFHIAIEYESSLFQTRTGNDRFFGYLPFNKTDVSADMIFDIQEKGAEFKPIKIPMPDNVKNSLTKLYDAIPQAHPGSTAKDWLSAINLGVNYVTYHIYAIWHCTGPKEFMDTEYPTFWWYPFAKSLVKASVKASQSGELISSRLIDGRKWAPKTVYTAPGKSNDEFGGAWSDFNGGEFVSWKDLCSEHEAILFKGESPPAQASGL